MIALLYINFNISEVNVIFWKNARSIQKGRLLIWHLGIHLQPSRRELGISLETFLANWECSQVQTFKFIFFENGNKYGEQGFFRHNYSLSEVHDFQFNPSW